MINAKVLGSVEQFIKVYKVNNLNAQQLKRELARVSATCDLPIAIAAYSLMLIQKDYGGLSDWIYPESDSIHAIARDGKNSSISVVFKSNPSLAYDYDGVPETTWLAFVSDRSKGKFYHRNIKDKFVSKTRYVNI